VHNSCIFVGVIKGGGGVVAPYGVVAVGIVVAECGRLCVDNLGHAVLSDMLVKCRNGTIE